MSGSLPPEHALFEMGNVRAEVELQNQKFLESHIKEKRLEHEAKQHTTRVNRLWAGLAVILIILLLGLAWLLH